MGLSGSTTVVRSSPEGGVERPANALEGRRQANASTTAAAALVAGGISGAEKIKTAEAARFGARAGQHSTT
jgi:hypothetical protein